jgi:Inner membrane component of T3SS, cytoplasmic domain
MIEYAVAQGVAMLGKVGYDIWKRWYDGREQGAAVVPGQDQEIYFQDVSATPSLSTAGPAAASELTVFFHPGDDLALSQVFQEQPALLVVSDEDQTEPAGLVVPGRVADTYELLVPPGLYSVSGFAFVDDNLAELCGVGWQDRLAVRHGLDHELSLAIVGFNEELSEAVFHDSSLAQVVFQTGEAFSITDSMVYLGRAESSDIVLTDLTVSATHARLVLTADGWFVEDLGSTNGSSVNGRRVAGYAHVGHGDVVTLGRVSFQFSVG